MRLILQFWRRLPLNWNLTLWQFWHGFENAYANDYFIEIYFNITVINDNSFCTGLTKYDLLRLYSFRYPFICLFIIPCLNLFHITLFSMKHILLLSVCVFLLLVCRFLGRTQLNTLNPNLRNLIPYNLINRYTLKYAQQQIPRNGQTVLKLWDAS